MLLLSKFRCNWLKLPSLSVLNTSRPLFLYLFSEREPTNSKFSKVFTENADFAESIKNSGIGCYSLDISDAPCNLIDKLEVTTVPVVLGLLEGRKLGEILKDPNQDSFIKLSYKLRSFSKPPESDHVINMRDLIKNGNLNDLRANVSYVKSNLARDIEVDPGLHKLVSEASIMCQNDTKVTLKELLSDLEKVRIILNKIETHNLSGKYTNESLKSHLWDLNKLVNRYLGLESETTHEDVLGSTSKQPANMVELRRCHLIKALVLKLISVKYFLTGKMTQSLNHSLEAYKVTVRAFHKDLITEQEFRRCGSREVLESLFSLFDPKNPLLLEAKADLENILGPRLLNKLPESTRPKGGVTRKRRGFGFRYIWHGLEYRPKKYKPKNLKQYLNEWRCVQDSNTPSFN